MAHKGLTYIREKKAKGEKLARTICYDYPMACIAEAADIDVINVGDSFQNVVYGLPDTLACRLDVMIEHARAVRRGAPSIFTMGDMPFGTYQTSEAEAVRNCCDYMAHGEVDCIKLEGNDEILPLIRKLTSIGVPVIAHSGLTPQMVNILGGYKTQGRDAKAAARIVETSIKFEEAGAIIVMLEAIPEEVAREVYSRLTVPFFGTGTGQYTDGPSINLYDMLGFFERTPKFTKRFAEFKTTAIDATKQFVQECRDKTFPPTSLSYKMKEGQEEPFMDLLAKSSICNR